MKKNAINVILTIMIVFGLCAITDLFIEYLPMPVLEWMTGLAVTGLVLFFWLLIRVMRDDDLKVRKD